MTWSQDNQLTEEEKKEGYVLLFNGQDFTGWHRNKKGYGGWKIVDGALGRGRGGGDLWTDARYGDFVLKIDYKLSPGCNSGVFFRTDDAVHWLHSGIEMQVNDDKGRKPNKHTNGAIYDTMAPGKQVTKPAGEWNRAVLTCKGSRITVEMNGEQIIDLDLDEWTDPHKNPDGTENKFNKAYKDMPREGHLGLQDHGDRVWYRNIKIKRLKTHPR